MQRALFSGGLERPVLLFVLLVVSEEEVFQDAPVVGDPQATCHQGDEHQTQGVDGPQDGERDPQHEAEDCKRPAHHGGEQGDDDSRHDGDSVSVVEHDSS